MAASDYGGFLLPALIMQGGQTVSGALNDAAAVGAGQRPQGNYGNPYMMLQLGQMAQNEKRRRKAQETISGMPGMTPQMQEMAKIYPDEVAEMMLRSSLKTPEEESFGQIVRDASGQYVQVGNRGTMRPTGITGYSEPQNDRIPVGYRRTAEGGLELDPGYVRGQQQLAEATRAPEKPTRQNIQTDPITGKMYAVEYDANGNARLSGPLNQSSEPKMGSEEAQKKRDVIDYTKELFPKLDEIDKLVIDTTRIQRSGLIPGGEKEYGQLRTMYSNFVNSLNKLYENGVLNEGDMKVIEGMFPDPANWRGGTVGETAFLASTKEVRRILQDKLRAAESRLGRESTTLRGGEEKDPWQD